MVRSKFNKLTSAEERVIIGKGTEPPFSGEYERNFLPGIYICRRCNVPLYRSDDKFDSHCGWPSFDDALPGVIKRLPDPVGQRTEIQCANCSAHLGHVFGGEKLTKKNVRHCVNSISMRFVPLNNVKIETIILGAGCFWCIEAVFRRVPGIFKVVSGYAGGKTENPTYEQVCSGDTAHAEVVKLEYFPDFVDLDRILEIFFSMHDPTSLNRQGNDVGMQYRSLILFTSKKQGDQVRNYLKQIQNNYEKSIVTELVPFEKFYPAEAFHENYFEKNPNQSYCLMVISPKLEKLKKKFGFV